MICSVEKDPAQAQPPEDSGKEFVETFCPFTLLQRDQQKKIKNQLK